MISELNFKNTRLYLLTMKTFSIVILVILLVSAQVSCRSFLEKRVPDRVNDNDVASEKEALRPRQWQMRCEYCDCYHDVEEFCEVNNCCSDM
ncbi:hypothetical protein ACROYT_G021984 [Oculina patagonica]